MSIRKQMVLVLAGPNGSGKRLYPDIQSHLQI